MISHGATKGLLMFLHCCGLSKTISKIFDFLKLRGGVMDIRYYLNSKGFSWKERDQKAIMNCPFCGDTEKKFAVSLVDGAYNCLHLNRCGRKGSFTDLQREMGDKPVMLDGDMMLVRRLPKKYDLPQPNVNSLTDEALKFLRGRGFSDETIKAFRIRSVSGKSAIAIPYYKDGKVVAVKYRDITSKKFWGEKNQEPALFNRDSITGDTLIIVEGEMDAMALHEYGISAVSVPNGAQSVEWIEHEWEYLQRYQNIILCYDSDAAGESKILEIANRLGLWRCYRCTFPYKDANECLMKHVPRQEIDKALAFSKDFCPVNLVSAGNFLDDVQTLFEHPEKLHGVPTPWEGLNSILKGWRDEELTIWSGRNGSGKSSLIGEVQIGLGNSGIRSCIATLEMPAPRILRWMVMQYLNIAHPQPNDVKQTMAWLDEWVYVVNTHAGVTPDDLLNKFKFAARKYGVKHFIIDSLMRVHLAGRDENKEQTQFVSDLLTFAKEYKVHIHLVAHPRKGETDSDTPDKVDISGSGNITNLAHNVVVVWRPSAKDKKRAEEVGKSAPDSRLYVKKNREFGLEGSIKFRFNESTKHFTEIVI